jgi:hypothetical protein
MSSNIAYLIDRYEVRLKSARAAYDWRETAAIFDELQKLYAMQNELKYTA